MVYNAGRNSADRTKTVILVTAIEAGVIYAVIAGLTMTIHPPPPPPLLTTHDVTNKPPAPTPTPTAASSPIVQPTVTPTLAPLLPTAGPTTIPSPGPTGETGPYTGPTITPTADPAPKFDAKAPRPRGRQGEWVTPNDYPAQDLREGNQGLVRVRLAVSVGGVTTGCTVTTSSGFPRLDAAACNKLVSRSHFDPATDNSGDKTGGVFNTAVRWTIPNNAN